MQTVVTAIVKCLSRKYFLFCSPAWKCFCSVYYQSQVHRKYFCWQSGLKTFHGDYRLQQYILAVKVSYIWVKIFFVSWVGFKTFWSLYHQTNKFAVMLKNMIFKTFFCYPSNPNKFQIFRCGTHLYMSLFLSIPPSVCRSVAPHISGTVNHLIIIFGTHM